MALAQITSHSFTVLTGIVTDNRAVASVRVASVPTRVRRVAATADRALAVDRVEFAARVPLDVGVNRIVVEATDTSGRMTSMEVGIVRVPPSLPFDANRRWGLFVSLRQYRDDPRVPARLGSRIDGPLIVDRLAAGIPSVQVERLVDERATRDAVLQALSAVTRIPKEDAREILVYLDGWVRLLAAGKGDPQPYFLPYDASAEDLLGSAIPVAEIIRILDDAKAQRLVVIVNTSFAGQAFKQEKEPRGRAVLAAATDEARSAPELGGRSIFLLHFAEAMNELSLERGGVFQTSRATPVSLAEVFDRARIRVVTTTSGRQVPVMLGDRAVVGTFFLAPADARESVLRDLAALLIDGQLTREQFLRAANALVQGFTSANIDLSEAILRYAQRRITVEELARQLLPSKEIAR